jgi:hypothetical protein
VTAASTALVGPVRVRPELRDNMEIAMSIRNVSQREYIQEAISTLIELDIARYPVGFQALREARARAREEAESVR